MLRCYSELKKPDKALLIGETLLARYPSDAEILYQLSRLHAERSSDLMSTLVRTAPDSAWTHYANAQVQESLDRLDAAAKEYRRALEKDPRMLGVHYKCIGFFDGLGSRYAQTFHQAVLSRAESAFDAPFGLRRMGGNPFDCLAATVETRLLLGFRLRAGSVAGSDLLPH